MEIDYLKAEKFHTHLDIKAIKQQFKSISQAAILQDISKALPQMTSIEQSSKEPDL